jgi:hypothetical protein
MKNENLINFLHEIHVTVNLLILPINFKAGKCMRMKGMGGWEGGE